MEIFRLFGSIFLKSDEADKTLDKVDKKAKKTGDTFGELTKTVSKWGLAIGTAAVGVATALGVKAFNASEDLKKALNGLQSETGTASESINGMKNAMLDIYNNNFGESFDEIGKSMALIAQQTGLSNQELADTTKNALAIQDTFGIGVSESVRGVNQLIKNFGIDTETAYNLIAQGAQNGLNANENLADTINEYSVYFAQLGLGATDMFNTLSNGAKSGVFDIDKLGDAVKEFGIRSKDGSDTTKSAFEQLGLNAESIGKSFSEGGEKGRSAFELVTSKINEMQDPMLQNQVGVALFGTMWEDIGSKGIAALTNTKGGIDTNIDALQQINAIKYDTFGEAMSGIGRQLETGILIPLGEKILPLLNDFANWIQENMPEIIQKFKDVAAGVIEFKDDTMALIEALTPLFAGIAAGAVTFGIYTLAINASAITTGIWTTVTAIATAAGTAFGAVLAFITSPIGLVVLAIGALVAAGVLLYKNWDTVKDFLVNTWNLIKDTATEIYDGIKKFFADTWGSIKDTISRVWDGVKESLRNTWNSIKDMAVTAFNGIVAFLDNWGIIDTVTGIIDGLKKAFTGIITFFTGVFTGDWKKAWDGIKMYVEGIWDSISSSSKGFVNVIIKYFNGMINSLNKLKFDVPDWVPGMGGKKFGLNIPNIPELAQGGNIVKAGRVMVGEQGPEYLDLPKGAKVTPLNEASGVTININNPHLFNERDADKIGQLIVGRLRTATGLRV